MSAGKSPIRTMHWARVCMLIEREAGWCVRLTAARSKLGRSGPDTERTALMDYCREQMVQATREGYDDTAQYIQHVLDDLEAPQ